MSKWIPDFDLVCMGCIFGGLWGEVGGRDEDVDSELVTKGWDCSVGTVVDGWGVLDAGMEGSTLDWSVCAVWEDWTESELGWGLVEVGCGKFEGCVMGIGGK